MSQIVLTREEFFLQLRHHLRRLPQEEIESAVQFYEEYLEEAGEENIHLTLESLGSPREIAVQLMANRTFQDLEDKPPSAKRGVSAVWIVILAIFASPVALPLAAVAATVVILLAAALLVVMIAVYAVIFCVIAAILAACVTLTAAGLVYICLSIPLFFQSVATGFFYLGTGLCSTAIGILILPLLVKLAQLSWRGTKVLVGKKIPQLFSKLLPRRAEK